MGRPPRSQELILAMSSPPAASTNCRRMPRSQSRAAPPRVTPVPAQVVLQAALAVMVMAKARAGARLPAGVLPLESVASLYSSSGCDVAADGGDHVGRHCCVYAAAG